MVSHLRAQFSRDRQWSESNASSPLTRLPGILDGFGRSPILPRETREYRGHIAETISRESARHSWKFGGDALLTNIHNFFPSAFGGEYIFDPIKGDPSTFQPQIGGLELTPLRAYAHPTHWWQGVPRPCRILTRPAQRKERALLIKEADLFFRGFTSRAH